MRGAGSEILQGEMRSMRGPGNEVLQTKMFYMRRVCGEFLQAKGLCRDYHHHLDACDFPDHHRRIHCLYVAGNKYQPRVRQIY